MSDPAQAEQLFAQALAHSPTPDILVNGAGEGGAHKPVVAMTPAEFEHPICLNLFGPFYTARPRPGGARR